MIGNGRGRSVGDGIIRGIIMRGIGSMIVRRMLMRRVRGRRRRLGR